MHETAKDVPPADPHPVGSLEAWCGIGWMQGETSMRPGPVVMLGVRTEDVLQVTPTRNQHVVEALSSSTADPAFGIRVGASTINLSDKRRVFAEI